MSWRTGSRVFVEIWYVIHANIDDADERIALTADLLRLFIERDLDPWDVEGLHPDVRAAIVKAGFSIREPERYPDS
jgi:hypothetical protein